MSYFPLLFVFSLLMVLSSNNLLHLSKTPSASNVRFNERPIIGVFAQPSDYPKQFPTDQFSYIASSYVKFIESAGARVVPIPYDLPYDQLKKLFNSLNGLVFPGGSALLWDDDLTHATMSNMTLAGQYLISLAIEANENGDYFPVWGTCLGFELMMIAISNNKDILGRFNSFNHVLKIEYVSNETRIFRNLSDRLKEYSENIDTLYFNHHYGITPQDFISNQALNNEFFISTLSHTNNGTAFVGSIEGKHYPFYGVQFHPEKSPFEWKKDINASHTLEAVQISQEIANFIVNESRKNSHAFSSEKEAERFTIYNHNPIKVGDSFMGCYFFPKPYL